jgi:site-specific recombinase XerD
VEQSVTGLRDNGEGLRTTLPDLPDDVALRFDEPEVIVRNMLIPDRAIDDFLGDCRSLRWSERSIRSYRDTLYRFADGLPEGLDVSNITADHIRRYRATRAHLAVGTVAGEEAHIASLFKWLRTTRKIARNPMDEVTRTKRIPAEDLEVTTLEIPDVVALLEAAKPGAELNATAIAAYLGPRRHAIALARDTDYDGDWFRFREKGSKAIAKRVPVELATVLDASIARGEILPAPHNYLVPPQGPLSRKGDRDDRVIWRLIKQVAHRAGVDCHVHALRAAFAVFYLECNPDDLLGLKELLGHRSLNTTLIYLRRLNKQARMERVRSLSWGGETAAWLTETPRTNVGGLALSGGGRIRTSVAGAPADDPGPREHPHVTRLRAARERARLLAELEALDAETTTTGGAA